MKILLLTPGTIIRLKAQRHRDHGPVCGAPLAGKSLRIVNFVHLFLLPPTPKSWSWSQEPSSYVSFHLDIRREPSTLRPKSLVVLLETQEPEDAKLPHTKPEP